MQWESNRDVLIIHMDSVEEGVKLFRTMLARDRKVLPLAFGDNLKDDEDTFRLFELFREEYRHIVYLVTVDFIKNILFNRFVDFARSTYRVTYVCIDDTRLPDGLRQWTASVTMVGDFGRDAAGYNALVSALKKKE